MHPGIILRLCGIQSNFGRMKYIHTSAVSQKIVQFMLSDIGEGIREVTVNDWDVKVGDRIAQFDSICTVESDKASVNITSRYDGVVKKLYYNVGDVALVGKPLVDIDTPDQTDQESSSSSDEEEIEVGKQEIAAPPKHNNKVLTTPAVRRIAAEYNLNLGEIPATGRGGRLLKQDLLEFLQTSGATSPTPGSVVTSPSITSTPTIPGAPSDQVKPITGFAKVMVSSMTQSNQIPAFNYYEEINVTKLVCLRQEIKNSPLKVSYMPFFIKAVSQALSQYPIVNSSLDDKCENIIYREKHNIGVAVDSKLGLAVPVIKEVQRLSVVDVARELNRLLEAGRAGTFKPADLRDGTFSISNIGTIGGTYARPLIVPGQVAIVALGKIQRRPVFNERGDVVPADILYTSWSADHRIIEGAVLARFVNVFKHYLENPSLLALGL